MSCNPDEEHGHVFKAITVDGDKKWICRFCGKIKERLLK